MRGVPERARVPFAIIIHGDVEQSAALATLLGDEGLEARCYASLQAGLRALMEVLSEAERASQQAGLLPADAVPGGALPSLLVLQEEVLGVADGWRLGAMMRSSAWSPLAGLPLLLLAAPARVGASGFALGEAAVVLEAPLDLALFRGEVRASLRGQRRGRPRALLVLGPGEGDGLDAALAGCGWCPVRVQGLREALAALDEGAWQAVFLSEPLLDVALGSLLASVSQQQPACLSVVMGEAATSSATLAWHLRGAAAVWSLATPAPLLVQALGHLVREHALWQRELRLARRVEAVEGEAARLQWLSGYVQKGLWEWSATQEREVAPRGPEAWCGFMRPEERARFAEAWSAFLAGKEDAFSLEYGVQDAGQQRWVATQGEVVVRSDQGAPLRVVGTHTDVTARKRAEQALQASEAYKRAMLDAIPDLMFVFDRDGHFIDYKATGDEQLILSPAHFVARHYSEVLPPELARITRENLERLTATGVLQSYIYAVGIQGETRYFEGRLVKCGAERALAIVRDVTAQKEMERALQASEAHFRSIVDNSAAAYFFVDHEGRIRQVNPAWLRFFNREEAEAVFGQHFSEVVGESEAFWGRDFPRGLREGVVVQGEALWHPPTGQMRWHSISASPLWREGRLQGMDVFVFDVSEQKQAEQSYQRLFLEMRDAFAVHALIRDEEGAVVDGRLLAVNPAFEKMSGRQASAVVGHLVSEIWPEASLQIVRLAEAALQGTAETLAYESQDLGKTFEVMAFCPAPEHLACIFRDVTQRRRAEEEKAKLESLLFQAQKLESIGRLAGGIAHDFNNMLGVILGHVEMALEGAERATAPLRQSLEQIQDAAQRSAELTRRLLAFARKQANAPRVVDLNAHIAGMLMMLRRLLGEEIALEWQPEAALWTVQVDPSQIDQVMANLCVNARDAIAAHGRITISTANCHFEEVDCTEHPEMIPGAYVMLAVTDDGGGMARQVQARLFEPFFTTKEAGKGTGLGLAMVYGIVKQNRGFIHVYSEVGRGSSFKLYFPRHGAAAETVSSAARRETPRAKGLETVLVVEDEAGILAIVKTMLERHGYAVLATTSAGEALALAQKHGREIDLLLTDVVMPESDGRALAQQVREWSSPLAVVFMSGYAVDVMTQPEADAGVGYLQKPFTQRELLALVRELLDTVGGRAGEP